MKNQTTTNLSGLHRVISMMAKDLDEFCREYSIQYYLMGGTALGAMRHGGFIPWDDDFDIFMDRKNYLKFLQCAKQHLDTQKYYFQGEDTPEWPLFFTKIRLNGTIYREENNTGRQMHEGIYIDIMCLNSTFQTRSLRYLQFFSARILSAQALARRGYATRSKKKKGAIILARWLCRGPIKWFFKWVIRDLGDRSSLLVGHFFGRAPFRATSFERVILGKPRYVPFENLNLPVPEQVERYLTVRFGSEYMKLPSDEVRASYPSHALEVDFGDWKQLAIGTSDV